MSSPLVSFITTFYNSGQFVHSAMECMLNQTYRNIEFICVNDGSKDETLKRLKEYQDKDDRIIIIDKKNEGYAHFAKAAAQEVVKGKYTFLFDHDDHITLDFIENAVQLLETSDCDAANPEKILTVLPNGDKIREDFLSQIISGIEAFKGSIGGWKYHIRPVWKTEVFKTVSYREEPLRLVNYDEIIIRKQILKCKKIAPFHSIYSYLFQNNSQIRNQSIRLIDFVDTDKLLRELLKNEGFYGEYALAFEKSAFRTLLHSAKLYYRLRNVLTREEKKSIVKRLEIAYDNLNKKILFSMKASFFIRIYNRTLLSNFSLFLLYNKLKVF